MDYRLVKLDEEDKYVQIFDETSSKLVGSILKIRRWGFFRAYQLRIHDEVYDLTHRLYNPRSWTIGTYHIGFRWKLLGRKITIDDLNSGETFVATDLSRGKLVLKNEEGRTGMEIDPTSFSSSNMVRVTTYDRVNISAIIATTVLTCDRYGLW